MMDPHADAFTRALTATPQRLFASPRRLPPLPDARQPGLEIEQALDAWREAARALLDDAPCDPLALLSVCVEGALLTHIAWLERALDASHTPLAGLLKAAWERLLLEPERQARTPFQIASERAGLDEPAQQHLAFTLAPELFPALRPWFARAQGHPGWRRPRVALLARLTTDTATRDAARCEALHASHPLRAQRLLWLDDSGASDLLDCSARPSCALASFVRGEDAPAWPPGVRCVLERPARRLDDLALDEGVASRCERLLRALRGWTGGAADAQATGAPFAPRPGLWTLIEGPAGAGKTSLASALIGALGARVVRVPCAALTIDDALSSVREALDWACFTGDMLCLDDVDQLALEGPQLARLVAQLEAARAPLMLTARRLEAAPQALRERVSMLLPLRVLDPEQRARVWRAHLAPHLTLGAIDWTQIATQHRFEVGEVERAATSCVLGAVGRGAQRLETPDLAWGARQLLDLRSARVHVAARRAGAGLERLVLPDETRQQVEALLNACRQRARVLTEWGFADHLATGKGIVALFCGEPGTGKTFCAELLAAELELRLEIVSIPDTVSKWVGETEKAIQRLFDHARATNAMLLFDEADSLFSKRVKVNRASDRYLNMQVNLLLQEIERFEGVALMTTNLDVNLDKAFSRRVQFQVHFPLPGEAERAQIWASLLPPKAPTGALDLEALAEDFALSGGQIKNAVMKAAYQAAGDDAPIGMDQLYSACISEYRTSGRLVPQSMRVDAGA